MMKKRVLVRGPSLSQSGYGLHCRYLLRALKEYEDLFDVYLITTNWGGTSWLHEDSEERRWIDSIINKTVQYQQQGGQFDMTIQCTIPSEWKRVAPLNIGVTAGIETNLVSPEWILATKEVDRVIVVSEHAKKGFIDAIYNQTDQNGNIVNSIKCDVPIHVVNYPFYKVEKEKKVNIDLDYDFNYLAVAQWSPRKNLENTIKWFIEEFIDQEVGLVLKVSTMNNSIIDRYKTEDRLKSLLFQYPDRKCKVYLLHGFLTEEEMVSLYKNPKIKAFISLAHGEGFGLPIFEAAQHGLPIITIPWSGQNDFLFVPTKDKKTKEITSKPLFAKVDFELQPIQREAIWPQVLNEGTQWAFAQQGSYKMRLREVKREYNRFKQQAKTLQKHILNNFKEVDKNREFVSAILGEEIKKFDISELPKVSILTSCFRGGEFIEGFMKDITSQTIFKEKCELCIVDANDYENDEYYKNDMQKESEVIKQFMKQFPDNIKYKKLNKDPGLYGCWNEALKMSTGDFVTNANLDDRKRLDALEKYARELVTNPDVGLTYADLLITDKPNERFSNNSAQGRKYNFPEHSIENLLMINYPHCCPMWRKSLHDIKGCELFNPELKSAGDWDMFLRFAIIGKQKFKKIQDTLGLYFWNPTGVSTNPENFSWKREEEEKVYNKYSKMYEEMKEK